MRLSWPSIVVPLLLALLCRGIYLSEIRDTPEFSHPGLDAAYHIYWARGLAEGDWTNFQGREDPQLYRFPYYRPPGYAFFLSLIFRCFGSGLLLPRIFQFLLGLGTVLLVSRLSRRLFDDLTALLAGLGAAVYWIFIYYEGELVGVAWSVFFVLLFAELLVRGSARQYFPLYLSAGAVLGLLIIFRPNALLLFPPAAVWAAWPIRKPADRVRLLRAATGLFLGLLAAVLPVTVRNYAVSKELIPISVNAGISFGVANNEMSDGTTHFIPAIGNIGTPFDWPRIVRKLEIEFGRPLSHGEASNYLTRQAFDFALRSPAHFLRLTGRKALLFWGPREIRNLREVHYARLHSPLLRLLPGNFSLVLALAILGAGLIFAFPQPGEPKPRVSQARAGALIVTLVLVYFLSMLPFAAGARYRVPVIPFLLILGASALRRIAALLAARRWSASLFAAAAAGGLYLLCSINYAGFQPAPEKWHYDRGLARLAAGDWNGSITEFDRALVYQPGYGSAYTNRGIALQKAGLLEEAERSYRRALQLDPASLPPRKNLADLLLEEGKAEEAFALYQEALAAGPEYTGVAVDLARGLAREGRGEAAAAIYRDILRACPDTADARLGLGNLLLEAGDPVAAGKEYGAAVEINPHSIVARYNLANALIADGRIEEGIAEYREVLLRDPAHRDSHNNLGIQLAAQGDLSAALRHFTAAIDSDPEDPAGYYNRGLALIKLGRPSEAVADLEKTLELSPDSEPALRALAVARGQR